MKIACIIPVINEETQIAECIERAWRSGVDEVIVSDGGSTDRTREIVGEMECVLVQGASGRARQQNAGAAASTADVLYFQHADNWLESNAAEQIRKAFEKAPTRVCGAFHQRIDAGGMKYRLLEWGNAARVRWLGAPYGDQGIFVRRDVFEREGGFPDVPILEELLLMRRLRKTSWPILLPGPLVVNARRWIQNGVIKQTLRNWQILTLHALGRPPENLIGFYPRHDQPAN